MDLFGFLLLLAAGCAAGFLAGFFGVGGGIILVPILLVYFKTAGVSSLVATHLAFGTSLLVVVFAAASSTYKHHKNGHIIWRAVLVIGAVSALAAIGGSMLAAALRGSTLQTIFALAISFVAVRFLLDSKKRKEDREPQLSVPALSLTGAAAGIIAPLAGIGGGVVSIPMMSYLLRFPLKKAVGTSSATIVITATVATVGYVVKGWGETLLPEYTLGFVDYLAAIPLILGTLPCGALGAAASHRSNVKNLRKLFGVLLLVVAVKMLFF